MELYNDNCFNIFPQIQDNYVDLFVLDLPYANKKFGNCTACSWDTPIDLKKMWEEIKRIMKPNATIVFFCNTKFGWALIDSNPKWFKYDLIWKKSRKVGFLSANKMPLRQHENIYIFKDKQGTYNAQKIKENTNKNNKKKDLGMIKGGYYRGEGQKPFKRMPNDPTTSHPTSIIEMDNTLLEMRNIIEQMENTILDYKNPTKTIHRTQKPVDLLEWLISSYSNEGDVVMDFCMGSGTAAVAAQNLNRKFIGVEMDKEIFDKAYKRIKE